MSREVALRFFALRLEALLVSAFGQIVEQTGLERLQGLLLLTKEIRLRLARALSFQRMAIKRVVGQLNLPRLAE